MYKACTQYAVSAFTLTIQYETKWVPAHLVLGRLLSSFGRYPHHGDRNPC